jgi:hypothetical protein
MICLNDIKSIIRRDGGIHISIFMPTHHRGGENQQDPIRLRNLMRQAEEKLIARGLRSTEARSLVASSEQLLTDNLFWRQQSDGLALFIEPEKFMYYRIPMYIREEVEIGERYYIKPLIPLISECGWFYILSLGRHENRLMQCTASGSVRVNLESILKNIPEALFLETTGSRMQYHGVFQGEGSDSGAAAVTRQGEGSRPDYDTRNLIKYFEQVNQEVIRILAQEKAPLILSAVDYLYPLYRKVNSYPNLLEEGIPDNPDGVSDDNLREHAWGIVRPYFNKVKSEAIGEYNRSAGTGLTAAGESDVIKAAVTGRIRFLFLAEGIQKRGSYDKITDSVVIHPQPEPGDEDLMDLAASQTLNHAGTIFVLKPEEVPGGDLLSAVLRY